MKLLIVVGEFKLGTSRSLDPRLLHNWFLTFFFLYFFPCSSFTLSVPLTITFGLI